MNWSKNKGVFMKDLLTLVFFLIMVMSLAACQPQDDSSSLVEDQEESAFTLNGAGE